MQLSNHRLNLLQSHQDNLNFLYTELICLSFVLFDLHHALSKLSYRVLQYLGVFHNFVNKVETTPNFSTKLTYSV